MSKYQNMKNYSGSLYGLPGSYDGVEYDWEVPDNQVVGTPGGVSTIHHHYTHGFNGRGNTSSDIYAGQGQRYISGAYGNLYNTGHEAGQSQGYYPSAPDYQYWQNQPSQQSYYNTSPQNTFPEKKMHGLENFNGTSDVANVGNDGTTPISDDFDVETNSQPEKSEYTLVDNSLKKDDNFGFVMKKKNKYIIIGLVTVFLVCVSFWVMTSHGVASKFLASGGKLSLRQNLYVSVGLTVLFFIAFWLGM